MLFVHDSLMSAPPDSQNPTKAAKDAIPSLAASHYRKLPPSRQTGCRFRGLELIVHAGGKPDLMTSAPGRGACAAVVDERLSGAVVTVCRHAAAAGAEIVVGIGRIDRVRRIDVPVKGLVKMMFPR